MESIVFIVLNIVALYLILGFIFALVFLAKGINTVDENAKGSGLLFKIMITPALTVFWILFLNKWIKSSKK